MAPRSRSTSRIADNGADAPVIQRNSLLAKLPEDELESLLDRGYSLDSGAVLMSSPAVRPFVKRNEGLWDFDGSTFAVFANSSGELSARCVDTGVEIEAGIAIFKGSWIADLPDDFDPAG